MVADLSVNFTTDARIAGMRITFAIVAWLLSICVYPAATRGELPDLSWIKAAPPLEKPSAGAAVVRTVEDLFGAVAAAREGQTILIADGHYFLPRMLDIRTDRVTLRGQSGKREKVVLDGAKSSHGELVAITGASGVTIADLTVQNVKWNGIKLNTDKGTTEARIYNCVLHNIWQRAIKGPMIPIDRRPEGMPRDCRIEHCLFYNDRPKRLSDDEADTFGGDYVGGIDCMGCDKWVISDNVFVGIQGLNREGRGAVFLWMGCSGCVVERNVFIDCDQGICLGNAHLGDVKIHCTDCIVANNFLCRTPEGGIVSVYTKNCRIVHNTVYDPESRQGRLVRIVFDAEGFVVANNLLVGPAMRLETKDRINQQGNVVVRTADWLADVRAGNLHLAKEAADVVDAGDRKFAVERDFDGALRGEQPDVGADER